MELRGLECTVEFGSEGVATLQRPERPTVQIDHAAAPARSQASSNPHCDRVTAAGQVIALRAVREGRGDSIRTFATHNEVPRSTVQDRVYAANDNGLPSGYKSFFESPCGLQFVLRLMVTVLVFFVLRGGCSVELVAEFFEALGLQRFVACSPSTLRRIFTQILEHTRAWGQLQYGELAPKMTLRDVVLALDENFHWDKMLLVIMDIGTGFLFAEVSSDSRDGETWEKEVRNSLVGYKVTLCAVTRDAGSWLGVCAEGLKVPAGQDIFHIQYGVCKASARPMALRVTRAQEAIQKSEEDLAKVQAARAREEAAPRPPGRPPDWEGRETRASDTITAAKAHLIVMQAEREAMQASIRALGDAHHPVDLTTGKTLDAVTVREKLQDVAEDLSEQSARANLGARAIKALNAVFKRLDELAWVVTWWHEGLRDRLRSLSLPEMELSWIETALMPALYVQHRISLARNALERARLFALWERLRSELLSSTSPWWGWEPTMQLEVQSRVQLWVKLFPRSTSALEGHNGQDSLVHHQRHRLSDGFRKARIVVRNYVVTRADGTTAAQRLFGNKPGDLIEYLCERIKLPARGRRRESKLKPQLLALTG